VLHAPQLRRSFTSASLPSWDASSSNNGCDIGRFAKPFCDDHDQIARAEAGRRNLPVGRLISHAVYPVAPRNARSSASSIAADDDAAHLLLHCSLERSGADPAATNNDRVCASVD
jgi:hypothetical protein